MSCSHKCRCESTFSFPLTSKANFLLFLDISSAHSARLLLQLLLWQQKPLSAAICNRRCQLCFSLKKRSCQLFLVKKDAKCEHSLSLLFMYFSEMGFMYVLGIYVTDVYARGVSVNLTPLTSKRGALATDVRGCSLWRCLLERPPPAWESRVRDPLGTRYELGRCGPGRGCYIYLNLSILDLYLKKYYLNLNIFELYS